MATGKRKADLTEAIERQMALVIGERRVARRWRERLQRLGERTEREWVELQRRRMRRDGHGEDAE